MAWLSNQGLTGSIDFRVSPSGSTSSGIFPGPGITISGNTITNDGIRSVLPGGGIQIGGDVNHNPTISLTAGATGVEECLPGTGIGISGTPALPLISNTGVISVTAGTNVTLGGTAANPIINAAGGGGSGAIEYATNVSITAAGLAGAGQVVIFNNADPAGQYQIINAFTSCFGSTNFDLGGDRDIIITDGTSEYGRAQSFGLETAISTNPLFYVNSSFSPGDGIFLPTVNSIGTPTVAGANIYATYSGGTTDYVSGTLLLCLIIRKL